MRPSLVRLAYRYLWNAHDAEEIVQDAIALAWREAGQETTAAEHGDAWLYRVTINLAINRLRRIQAGPMPPGDIAAAPAPDSQQESDELMQRVRLAIRELPDRQQAAIVLRDIEGLPYDRAAAVLEVSPVAARVLVHRAREAVRQILLTRWPDTFGSP
jgi:RNA polymerase sigma-70 factor (ECF subfamily)